MRHLTVLLVALVLAMASVVLFPTEHKDQSRISSSPSVANVLEYLSKDRTFVQEKDQSRIQRAGSVLVVRVEPGAGVPKYLLRRVDDAG